MLHGFVKFSGLGLLEISQSGIVLTFELFSYCVMVQTLYYKHGNKV